MERNFPAALSAVLKHEGGYVDHPKDPGGATNKGITIGTFRKWVKKNGTKADLRAISDADVAKVYRKHYWSKVRGDDLPDGIDYAVFDFAVNSGPGRAAKFLQAVLGVPQDGAIGPVTIAAAHKAAPATVIHRLCDDRLAFLQRLSTWDAFKNGWRSRVLGVRNDALHMVAAAPQPAPQPQERPSPLPTPAKPDPASPEAPVSQSRPDPSPPGMKAAPPNRIGIFAVIITALAAL